MMFSVPGSQCPVPSARLLTYQVEDVRVEESLTARECFN